MALIRTTGNNNQPHRKRRLTRCLRCGRIVYTVKVKDRPMAVSHDGKLYC